MRLMTLEQINNKGLLEIIGKRQREFIEANAEILDWAMKTVSGKKRCHCHVSEYHTIYPTP